MRKDCSKRHSLTIFLLKTFCWEVFKLQFKDNTNLKFSKHLVFSVIKNNWQTYQNKVLFHYNRKETIFWVVKSANPFLLLHSCKLMTTEILDFSHHFTPKNVLFIRFSDLKETNTHLSNVTILCIPMCRIEFSGSIDTNLSSIRYEICEFHGIYFRYLPLDIFVRCGIQPTMDIFYTLRQPDGSSYLVFYNY